MLLETAIDGCFEVQEQYKYMKRKQEGRERR